MPHGGQNAFQWTPEREAYLRQNHAQLSLVQLSLQLGTSDTTIRKKLKEWGVRRKKRSGDQPRIAFKQNWHQMPEDRDRLWLLTCNALLTKPWTAASYAPPQAAAGEAACTRE